MSRWQFLARFVFLARDFSKLLQKENCEFHAVMIKQRTDLANTFNCLYLWWAWNASKNRQARRRGWSSEEEINLKNRTPYILAFYFKHDEQTVLSIRLPKPGRRLQSPLGQPGASGILLGTWDLRGFTASQKTNRSCWIFLFGKVGPFQRLRRGRGQVPREKTLDKPKSQKENGTWWERSNVIKWKTQALSWLGSFCPMGHCTPQSLSCWSVTE